MGNTEKASRWDARYFSRTKQINFRQEWVTIRNGNHKYIGKLGNTMYGVMNELDTFFKAAYHSTTQQEFGSFGM